MGQSKNSSNALIPANNCNKSLAEPKNIFENNQTLVSCFRKPKIFWKFRSFSNSHQRGVLSPSNLTEHLMNKMGWAQNRISKTIRSSLQQVKNQISFSNRCTFKSTAVLISELTQHLMTSLREPRYYSRKWVNVHREILKRQIHSKNFIPP